MGTLAWRRFNPPPSNCVEMASNGDEGSEAGDVEPGDANGESDGTVPTDWGAGMAIGLAVGVAIGVAMDNLAIGIAIGLALGPAFGLAQSNRD